MRLIDAYALLAEMHNVILEDGEDRRTFYEVIERQPTIAEAERKTGKWIPCSERLPEKKGTYLVTAGDDVEPYTDTDMWSGTGFWAYGKRAVAWMPLPKAYKEENND